MLERLTKGLLVSLSTMLFVIALPFLLGLLLIPTLPPTGSAIWCSTGEPGTSCSLWSSFGTAAVIYLLLINGVYHL
jgi:hypothetical protein